MPWTFSHIAAALPLLRFCRSRTERCALVIGCVSPDIGYYLGSWGQQLKTHSFAGSFTVCLPLGWSLLLILICLRAPVLFMMPKLVRQSFENAACAQIALNGEVLLRCSGWLILGAWTHIFWDDWTHNSGLFVQHFAKLQAPIWFDWPAYRWLQHLSTAFGVLLLACWLLRWQRSLRRVEKGTDDPSDRVRLHITLCCMLIAAIWALQHAMTLAAMVSPALYWRAFTFQFATFSVRVFIALWLAAALGFSRWNRQRSSPGATPTPLP